jgi:hypothetical protein
LRNPFLYTPIYTIKPVVVLPGYSQPSLLAWQSKVGAAAATQATQQGSKWRQVLHEHVIPLAQAIIKVWDGVELQQAPGSVII